MSRARSAAARERGAGTVLVLAAIVLVLSVTLLQLHVVRAVHARHRARAAADLTALAGARAVQLGADHASACTTAGRTARANGAEPVTCAAAPAGTRPAGCLDVEVRVPLPGARLPGVPGHATARARAGPALGAQLPPGVRP